MKKNLIVLGLALLLTAACTHKGQEITSLTLSPGESAGGLEPQSPGGSVTPEPLGDPSLPPPPPPPPSRPTVSKVEWRSSKLVSLNPNLWSILDSDEFDLSRNPFPLLTLSKQTTRLSLVITANDPEGEDLEYTLSSRNQSVSNNNTGRFDYEEPFLEGQTINLNLKAVIINHSELEWNRTLPVMTASENLPPRVTELKWEAVKDSVRLSQGTLDPNGENLSLNLTLRAFPFDLHFIITAKDPDGDSSLIYALARPPVQPSSTSDNGTVSIAIPEEAANRSFSVRLSVQDSTDGQWGKDVQITVHREE